MLKLTRTGIGLLTRQYRSVLHKCWMINVGLWQAMGDAVSKAVSVPAKLVASLLSGGALNGEAFNALDEILLSRLFERKLASLTAIGLTIAAATMPSEALAITPDEVMAEMNKSSAETLVTWTSYATSGSQGYDPNTHTGVRRIKVGGTYYYFSYTFDAAHAGDRGTRNTPASNVHYDGYSSGNGGAINNSASDVTLVNDYFVGNTASQYGGAIYNNYNSTINTLTGGFSGNSASAQGGAIYNGGTINTLTGDFSGNITNQQSGGAIRNNGTITTLTGNFSGNGAGIMDSGSGGAIHNGGTIDTLTGDFSGNSATSSGGAIFISIAKINTLTGNFSGNSAQRNGGAIFNELGTIGLLAKDKNISFYNNTDSSGYNDIYQSNNAANKYISLAAASGRQISFGGSIDGDAGLKNILNIGTDTTSGNYGGQYIFNSPVKNQSLVLGSSASGANVVLDSILQANGETTYGKLENDNLTVNGTGSKINMANGHVDANTLNTLTLNTDLDLYIDASLSNLNSDTITSANPSTNPGSSSVVIKAINLMDSSDNSSETLNIFNPSGNIPYKFAENVKFTGAGNVFKNVSYDNATGNLTLSNPITLGDLNTKIGNWDNGSYISAYDELNGSVGDNLQALDTAIYSVSNNLVNNYYRKLVKKDENLIKTANDHNKNDKNLDTFII